MSPETGAENRLAAALAARIRQAGPLGLAEFMDACLSDPQAGAYAARQPIGAEGDFITAPEISQIFGELIGIWTVAVWQSMGNPLSVTVAELGPGRGTLLSDALRSWRRFPAFAGALRLALVETGPALREVQQARLQAAAAATSVPLQWHDDIAALPDGPLIVIANEFLDALPIRQFVRRGDAWRERLIGIGQDGGFAFTESDTSSDPPELAAFAATAAEGEIAELRPALDPVLEQLSARAAAAPLAALFIDYGSEAPAHGDTLQAVRGHRFADPLRDPGLADLTAHVDFCALRERAGQRGLSAYGPMPQGEFLLKLGLAARQEQLLSAATPDQRAMLITGANRLIDPRQMGVLFKALALQSPGLPPPPPFTDGNGEA